MSGKTSVSKARSYKEIGAFWDEHDAAEFGEQIETEFDVDIYNPIRYYPVDNHFTNRLRQLAEKRGISKVTLINLWIQEKISQTDINNSLPYTFYFTLYLQSITVSFRRKLVAYVKNL